MLELLVLLAIIHVFLLGMLWRQGRITQRYVSNHLRHDLMAQDEKIDQLCNDIATQMVKIDELLELRR